MTDDSDRLDREAILARRRRFVAAALGGLTTSTLATACPCLDVAGPTPPETETDAETDAETDQATGTASGTTGSASSGATTEAGSSGAADSGDSGSSGAAAAKPEPSAPER